MNILSFLRKSNNAKQELQAIWDGQDTWRISQGLPELTEVQADELIQQATEELKAKRTVTCEQVKACN